jgi:flagellin
MAVNLRIGVGIGSNAGLIQLSRSFKMASVINTNISSLTAQRNLGMSQTSLSTSMQRLSSGLRINSAKDDAAGMAISDRMTTQVKGMNQAVRNANDAISLAQTAEGALGEIGSNLQRIRELAVQSANSTNSTSDREALQKEVTQLQAEVQRVATQTSFNDTKLLDGTFTNKGFQVGANSGQIINIANTVDAKTASLGKSQFAVATTGAASAANATATSGLTINSVTIANVAADATATTAQQAAKIAAAINDKSGETGVIASVNVDKIVLTSTTVGKDLVVAGSNAGDGISSGTTAATAATAKSVTNVDISTSDGAQYAIGVMDTALKEVNSARADLGAIQNRFSSVVNNLQTSTENLTASRSRIQDADFAAETANLSRAQILQQAGTAMVAQSNQLPQGVLALLR